MAAKRKQTPRLFNANPPRADDPLLGHLFVDREAELGLAIETLTADSPFDPKVHAVYGDSRTGKSHFVLRVLQAVSGRFETLTVNANSAGSARSALRLIWFALRDRLADRAGPEADAWLDWAQSLALLIDDQIDEAQVTVSAALKARIEGRLGFRRSHVQVAEEDATTHEVKLTVRRPDDAVLARHVRTLAQGLLECTERSLLINIDDLDLLNHPDDKRGVAEAETLLNLMTEVAALEGVVVIASVRNRFFTSRDKALRPLVEVRAFEPKWLREVLDKQVRVLHADEQIFDVPCRDALIRLARGRVGVFLAHCGRLWQFSRLHGIDLPIKEASFDLWLQDHVRRLSKDPSTARATGVIVEAVLGDAPLRELHLPGVDPEDGPFAYTVVRATAFALPDRVELVPEAVEAIRVVFGGRA